MNQSLRKYAALLLILPGILLTLLILAYPLYQIGELSVHDVNRFGKLRDFVGFENFQAVFSDGHFQESLLRTGLWTVCVVAGTIVIALFIAQILTVDFFGRGLARTIVMLPWALSLAMTAIVWRWALNGQFGMLNHSLVSLGLSENYTEWLATSSLAFPLEIFIGILVSVPFTVTIFLGGLTSIPPDIYDAAKVEGASFFSQYRRLTLPLLKPFIAMAVVLNMIYVFNSFPIIWVLTQGGPANETDILVTYLYKLAFRSGRLGEASAVSLIMLAILLILTLVYLRLQERGTK